MDYQIFIEIVKIILLVFLIYVMYVDTIRKDDLLITLEDKVRDLELKVKVNRAEIKLLNNTNKTKLK